MELAEQTVKLDIHHVGVPGVGLLKLFETQAHTDVTFLVSGKQRVRAHRVVLASQSGYFECLLFGPMKEGSAAEIQLEETPAEAFRELLKFAYSGSVSTLNLVIVLELMILADRFGFSLLKDGIENHLQSIITIDNVLQLYSHAQVSSAAQLQEKCETFLDQHARMVIKCPDVPFLPKENFKALISRDSFIVEEMQVFTAVQKWMECNRVSREEAADLLECVRLTEIPQSELKARVMPSGLFDQAQVLEAMGVREAVDRECMSPRGKTGENLNLFEESDTRLLTCTNYRLGFLPEKTSSWSCVSDFLFRLAVSAAKDPAYITVRFDDIYLVNQITFEGYSDPNEFDRESSPFCYQVWVSPDGDQWTTILDYSRLKCYSTQRLFFSKMAIRYVRILQTRGQEDFTVHLVSCSYVGPVPYRIRDLGVIAPFIPLTPEFCQYVRFTETGCLARAFLTFTQPYSINTIRFRLQDIEGSADVSVSVATKNKYRCYQKVEDFKCKNLSSCLQAKFEERPVSIISVTIINMRLPNQEFPKPDQPIPQFRVQNLVCQAVE